MTPRHTLHLTDVCTSYSRGTRIVDEFTARPLEAGRLVGLLGPNAAGKSTLIKSIAGVLPHDGTVCLRAPGQEYSGRRLRTKIGYVPQDLPRHAVLTAYETVLISARRTGRDPHAHAAHVMEELGIAHLAGRLIAELSGGQRQLVSVAQALVTFPEVLLLDEPTSALDLKHQIFLLDYLREWTAQRGAITVVAIHDINLAARTCDDMLVMKAGRLIAQGAPGEVLTPRLIAEVYGVDAKVLCHEGTSVVLPCSLCVAGAR